MKLNIIGKRYSLSAEVEAALLCIYRESLANVRKHAQASKVEVNLVFQKSSVRLNIKDDGIGFDPKVSNTGTIGLWDMSERARLLEGALTVQSEKGKGTIIESVIPVK